MSRSAFIGPCAGGGSRTDIHVDVSCQPIIHIDICSAHIDISFNPVIHVDISYQPIVYVDVSCTPVIASGLTNTNFDAFVRLRVSNPFTLFEYNSILGKNDYLIEENITGAATSTWMSGQSYIRMAVTNNEDSVVRQSREYVLYQPGKSKLVYMTGVLYDVSSAAATANLTTRLGMFDASMGIYIQMQNGTISVVEHDGVNNVIPRSSWTDPLDGTGPSGATVDFAYAQIFYFDFEWLGVGTVRCGIIKDGQYLPYYTFNHGNVLKAPYIPFAKLPVRYEIISTGSANAVHMICATVISEGGLSPIGKLFTYDNFLANPVPVVVKTITKLHALFGLRLKSTYPKNRATIKIKDIEMAGADSTTVCAWKVLLNPTYDPTSGGTLTWSPYYPTYNATSYAIDSCVEIGRPALSGNNIDTFYTDGQTLLSGFAVGKSSTRNFNSVEELVGELPIGSSIDGTPDEIVFVGVIPTSSAGNAQLALSFSFQWIEMM